MIVQTKSCTIHVFAIQRGRARPFVYDTIVYLGGLLASDWARNLKSYPEVKKLTPEEFWKAIEVFSQFSKSSIMPHDLVGDLLGIRAAFSVARFLGANGEYRGELLGLWAKFKYGV